MFIDNVVELEPILPRIIVTEEGFSVCETWTSDFLNVDRICIVQSINKIFRPGSRRRC